MHGELGTFPLVDGLRVLLAQLDRLRHDLVAACADMAPSEPVAVPVRVTTGEAEFLRAYA